MTLAKGAPTTVIDALASLAATTESSLSDAFDTQTAIQVVVEFLGTFGASALGAELRVYGSVDGTNYSTKPFAVRDIILEASATTRQVFSVPSAPRYLKFSVYNLGAVAITTVSIKVQAQTVS